MKILLPNSQLAGVADLLETMSLKPAASRARTKLLNLVREAATRFGVDEYELVSQYARLDEQGRPLIDKDGTFSLADEAKTAEFFTTRQQLLDTSAEVEGPTYEGHLKDLKDMLDTYDEKLSGTKAQAYDCLYEAVAEAIKKTDENH
ncbi:DUF1617 family protein [Actinotignum sp. GS-2025c]|uniref:DUF1617 family protein n=1 Tax=Actinotignum sp. GS-2025c TaxID=3427276 RepID=UPI003F463537